MRTTQLQRSVLSVTQKVTFLIPPKTTRSVKPLEKIWTTVLLTLQTELVLFVENTTSWVTESVSLLPPKSLTVFYTSHWPPVQDVIIRRLSLQISWAVSHQQQTNRLPIVIFILLNCYVVFVLTTLLSLGMLRVVFNYQLPLQTTVLYMRSSNVRNVMLLSSIIKTWNCIMLLLVLL